jgi:protein TonB
MLKLHVLFALDEEQPGATRKHGVVLPPRSVAPSRDVLAGVMLDRTSTGHVQIDAGCNRGIVLPPPAVVSSHDVFEEAMLDRTSVHQQRRPLDWVVSSLVHALVLLLLLAAPLYFTQGLDPQKLKLTFLVAPMPPAAPVPPAPHSVIPGARRPIRSAPHQFTPGKLTAPSFIPRVIATRPHEVAPPEEVLAGVPGGVPGGIPGGELTGVLGAIPTNLTSPVVAPPTEAPTKAPRTPVRVGGDVKAPRLLYAPELKYPPLALLSRVSGIVLIEAIIDEHGNVVEAHVISGDPLLIQEALKTVSGRKYEPTILDGKAVPIELRVEISFHFS